MLRATRDRTFGIVGIVLGVAGVVVALAAQDDKQTTQRMHQQLDTVKALDYAVIRGDLEDAATAAKALDEGMAATALPPASEKYVSEMRAAAKAAAGATDLLTAAAAAGSLQAACGNCHSAVGHTLKATATGKVTGAPSLRTRMREHIWSVEALAQGLQGPSDDLWKQGADSMKNARLITVQLKDPQLTKEVNEAEAEFRVLADRARDAKDQAARATAYGAILATCGHCHSLQGRVFGPGAPK